MCLVGISHFFLSFSIGFSWIRVQTYLQTPLPVILSLGTVKVPSSCRASAKDFEWWHLTHHCVLSSRLRWRCSNRIWSQISALDTSSGFDHLSSRSTRHWSRTLGDLCSFLFVVKDWQYLSGLSNQYKISFFTCHNPTYLGVTLPGRLLGPALSKASPTGQPSSSHPTQRLK